MDLTFMFLGARYELSLFLVAHDLWMRYWLAAGGIEPQRYSTIIIPPPQMVVNMKGYMDAFCAGEPWNAQP